jgi:hypothetical protein
MLKRHEKKRLIPDIPNPIPPKCTPIVLISSPYIHHMVTPHIVCVKKRGKGFDLPKETVLTEIHKI